MLRKIRDINEAAELIRSQQNQGDQEIRSPRSTIISNACQRIRRALADPLLSRRGQNE